MSYSQILVNTLTSGFISKLKVRHDKWSKCSIACSPVRSSSLLSFSWPLVNSRAPLRWQVLHGNAGCRHQQCQTNKWTLNWRLAFLVLIGLAFEYHVFLHEAWLVLKSVWVQMRQLTQLMQLNRGTHQSFEPTLLREDCHIVICQIYNHKTHWQSNSMNWLERMNIMNNDRHVNNTGLASACR